MLCIPPHRVRTPSLYMRATHHAPPLCACGCYLNGCKVRDMLEELLTVHSDLAGVGLTAAVAAALADANIPCNIVAAFHHDHVFVPAGQAQQALAALVDRAARQADAP